MYASGGRHRRQDPQPDTPDAGSPSQSMADVPGAIVVDMPMRYASERMLLAEAALSEAVGDAGGIIVEQADTDGVMKKMIVADNSPQLQRALLTYRRELSLGASELQESIDEAWGPGFTTRAREVVTDGIVMRDFAGVMLPVVDANGEFLTDLAQAERTNPATLLAGVHPRFFQGLSDDLASGYVLVDLESAQNHVRDFQAHTQALGPSMSENFLWAVRTLDTDPTVQRAVAATVPEAWKLNEEGKGLVADAVQYVVQSPLYAGEATSRTDVQTLRDELRVQNAALAVANAPETLGYLDEGGDLE